MLDKSTIQNYISNLGKKSWLKKFPKNPFKKRLETLTSKVSNPSPKHKKNEDIHVQQVVVDVNVNESNTK